MSDIRFNRWLHQSGTGGVYQDSAGSVGIGTTVPTELLDVQDGNIKIGNNIISSSGISTFSSIDVTTFNPTSLSVNGNNYPSVGPLSNRNLIINGAMQVAQRATQVTSVTTGGYKTCDRYYYTINSLGTWTIDQATDAPEGFAKSFKLTCTTADATPAATDYAFIQQSIEAQNLQHLKYGTSNAENLILSFWVKSNKTGNASLECVQFDNTLKQFTTSYTINSADTWEYKTITIPGDSAGVINDDNDVGITIAWWLNSGSNYTSGTHNATWETADNTNRNATNLGVGGATSDYFAITGVQLELGDVATPFEHRSFADELQKCHRYFEKSYDIDTTPGTNAGTTSSVEDFYISPNAPARIRFSVSKRVAPSIVVYDPAGNSGRYAINLNTNNAVPLAVDNTGNSGFKLFTNATAQSRATFHWTAEAEL